MCFDKTGTLSAETLKASEWRIAEGWAERATWLRAAVLAAEEGLAHPVARAVRDENAGLPGGSRQEKNDRRTGVLMPGLVSRRVVAGRGVIAEVRDAGGVVTEIGVGEWELGEELEAGENEERRKRKEKEGGGRKEEGGKVVFVFADGELAAEIVLEEKWRDGLAETVEELRALGLAAEVLTGDPAGDKAGLPL
ncbi:HAD family hydrolase, partial [Termitidicoccus mucosus]|uniref:HAD family hydrolase n=1 Tax=Termitidicoccus mucosus TaxID=1184151 RepID=UPI002FEDEF5F